SAPRCSALLSSLTLRPPPPATLFPYTTLFRSRRAVHPARRVAHVVRQVDLGRLPPVTPRQLQLAQPRGDQRVDRGAERAAVRARSEEHTSELQSRENLVCRLLLEKKKHNKPNH